MQKDPLLLYCEALDRGDMRTVRAWLKYMREDKELEAALFDIHARFDSTESYTEQLIAEREKLVCTM